MQGIECGMDRVGLRAQGFGVVLQRRRVSATCARALSTVWR